MIRGRRTFTKSHAFLEHNSDAEFWRIWRKSHDQPLRRVEAICFAIAHQWFGCRLPAVAQEETEQLPEPVRAWLEAYAHTPVVNLFHPAKDELWLHLSLLDPGYSRFAILRRRLMPLQLPGPVDAVLLPDHVIGWRVRLRRAWRYLAFLTSRTWCHARALVPTLWSGAAWGWSRLNLSSEFWSFFVASAYYDFGFFIFFLLFNLYLLKLGYNEAFLGLVSSCMLAGSVVGIRAGRNRDPTIGTTRFHDRLLHHHSVPGSDSDRRIARAAAPRLCLPIWRRFGDLGCGDVSGGG